MTEGYIEEDKKSNEKIVVNQQAEEEKEGLGIQAVKPDDEYDVEIFELEDTTVKDRFRKELLKNVQKLGFESVEDFVAKSLIAKMAGTLTKNDEILLKYIKFVGETQGYTASTKEYNIVSKIPQLNRNTLLKA